MAILGTYVTGPARTITNGFQEIEHPQAYIQALADHTQPNVVKVFVGRHEEDGQDMIFELPAFVAKALGEILLEAAEIASED